MKTLALWYLATCSSVALAATSPLSSAAWIWLSEPSPLTSAPGGDAYFLRTFPSPASKSASSAVITITCDNNFTLFVNGQPIGATPNPSANEAWSTASQFNAALNATNNVFAVVGMNVASSSNVNPAGLLALIDVSYTDGSSESVVSDAKWLVSSALPSAGDFPLPSSSNPSGFASATNETAFGGGDWGSGVNIAPASTFGAGSLAGSSWIWSTPTASSSAAVGTVGFRKTFTPAAGKTPSSVSVLATADNTFQFYINNIFIGAPPFDNNAAGTEGWRYAQRISADLSSVSSPFTFTFLATNFAAQTTAGGPSSAGLIAALFVSYTDGSIDTIRTDATWLAGAVASSTPATGFLGAADGTLQAAIVTAKYGDGPWGTLAIADALDARKVQGLLATSSSSSSSSNSNSGGGSGASGSGTTTFGNLTAPTSNLPDTVPTGGAAGGGSGNSAVPNRSDWNMLGLALVLISATWL